MQTFFSFSENVTIVTDGCDADGYHKSKAKRVRTTFTEEQLQVLQANFQIDSNPDGQDLERIASVTGLSKRVTQVWFQNSRARQKKHIHSGEYRFILYYKIKNNLRQRVLKLLVFFFFIFLLLLVPRDSDGNSYSRHINLQLTYSFQNTTHNSLHINNNNNHIPNNNNNNNNKTHGKSVHEMHMHASA